MTAESELDEALMIRDFDASVTSLKMWDSLITPSTSSEVIGLLVFSK